MICFFINDLQNQKFNIGAIMIDVFSRFMVVVPIKNKNEANIASGIIEGFNKMGGKPKILYTDDEGGIAEGSYTKIFERGRHTAP